jgi:hypothetical protein
MNQSHTLKERQAAQWFKLGRYWLQTASQAETKQERHRFLMRSNRAYKKAYAIHDEPWRLGV